MYIFSILGFQLFASSSSSSCHFDGGQGSCHPSIDSSSWEKTTSNNSIQYLQTRSDEQNVDAFKFITDNLNHTWLSDLSLITHSHSTNSSSSSNDRPICEISQPVKKTSDLEDQIVRLKSEIEVKQAEFERINSRIQEMKTNDEPKRKEIENNIRLIDENIVELNKAISAVQKLEKLHGSVFKDGKHIISNDEAKRIAKVYLDFQKSDNNVTINQKAIEKLQTLRDNLKSKQTERVLEVVKLNALRSDDLTRLAQDLTTKNQELKTANNELKKLNRKLDEENRKAQEIKKKEEKKEEEKKKQEAAKKMSEEAESYFQKSMAEIIEKKNQREKTNKRKLLKAKESLRLRLEEYFKEPEYSQSIELFKQSYIRIKTHMQHFDTTLRKGMDLIHSTGLSLSRNMLDRLAKSDNEKVEDNLVDLRIRKNESQNEFLNNSTIVEFFGLSQIMAQYSLESKEEIANLQKKLFRCVKEKDIYQRELNELKPKHDFFDGLANFNIEDCMFYLQRNNEVIELHKKVCENLLNIDQTFREIFEFLKSL